MIKYKAVLFGSIGTIIETSDLQRKAFNQAFKKNDLNWVWTKKIYKILLNTLNKLNNSDSVLRKDIVSLINDIKIWSSEGIKALENPPQLKPVGTYIGVLQSILTGTSKKIDKQQVDDTDNVTKYIKNNLTISNNNDSPYSSSSTKDIQYYKRLEEIINNLDDMLSKLAKTS